MNAVDAPAIVSSWSASMAYDEEPGDIPSFDPSCPTDADESRRPPAAEDQAVDYERRRRNLQAAMVAMRSAAAADGTSPVDMDVRFAASLLSMGDEVKCDDLVNDILDRRSLTLHTLATRPVLYQRDLTCKLAVLVLEILRMSEVPDETVLMLAAAALADAVVLDSGPIPLPPLAVVDRGHTATETGAELAA
jgi:hypothetical protein